MRIAFLSESGFTGKIPRDYTNMRTEYAWYASLDAMHYPINKVDEIGSGYDIGIVIIPKKNIDVISKIDLLNHLRQKCRRIGIMQEGPHWYFQDYPLPHQIWYYNILMAVDFILCHNPGDVKYYEGLTKKPCYWMSSLMLTDHIDAIPDSEYNIPEESVVIGGNFCHWYGGFDSYVIADVFECPIYAPSMGRKINGEELMDNIIHLPYMSWQEWVVNLKKFKYAIHLMRTHAAGTFALNCGYWGIPCIGYKGLATQEICHPQLTVDLGDLNHARDLATKLKEEPYFYEVASDRAKHGYGTFREEQFLNRWEKIVDEAFSV